MISLKLCKVFVFNLQVCLIERKSDKKVFAMKYVNKEACVALSAVNNVIEEVELLRLLDHPFITSIWYTFQVCLLFDHYTASFEPVYQLLICITGCRGFVHSTGTIARWRHKVRPACDN